MSDREYTVPATTPEEREAMNAAWLEGRKTATLHHPDCYYCGRPARYVHWETVVACCVGCITLAAWPDGAAGMPSEGPPPQRSP